MSAPSALVLRQRASFPYWIEMGLRYADLDPLGHVNNAALPMFFEQSRCDLVYPLLKTPGRERLDIVIARIVIEYVAELSYPGVVDIGTVVTRIGRKSITLGHGVFPRGQDACAGTGEGTIVFFDLDQRRSIEIPGDVRAALETLHRPGLV